MTRPANSTGANDSEPDVRRLLSSFNEWDADQLAARLAPNVCLSLAHRKVASGRRKVRQILITALASLAWCQLETFALWSGNRVAVVELDVRGERLDGSFMGFPATAVLRFSGSQVDEIQLFAYESSVPIWKTATSQTARGLRAVDLL